jgi:hypothetical protein
VDPRVTPVNGFTDIRDRNRTTANPDGALINPDFFVPAGFLGLSRSGGFVQVANVGHSTYHSFQADVKGRMSSRALWNLAYTFSKSIDNLSSDTEQAQQDNTRLFLNRGLSNFNLPHRFTASFVIDIPGLRGGRKFLNALTQGWRTSGLLTLQSGAPFTVFGPAARNAYQFQVASVRPDLAPGRTIESAIKSGRVQDRLDLYFDPTAFVNSEDHWGAAGRNILRGPKQRQLDLELEQDDQAARVHESGVPLGIVQRDQHADLRQSGVDDCCGDLHPVAIAPMRAGDDDAAEHGRAHLLDYRRAAHDAGGAKVDFLNRYVARPAKSRA